MNINRAIDRRLAELAICRLAAGAMARVFNVPAATVHATTRGRQRAARARQAAMYLAHIGFGLDYGTLARCFSRDRKTVRHACAVIEDARDDRWFDLGLHHVELGAVLLHQAVMEATREIATHDLVFGRQA